MIIGIDLDNTIIDYRNAFWKAGLSTGIFSERDKNSFSVENGKFPNKNQIKHRLKIEDNDEFKWKSLQGQVYGRFIQNATLYPGVANFLLHCKQREVKIYIISHKTEFGHHDKSKTSLRKAALHFLEQKDLLSGDYGIQMKDIFFFDTRCDKVNKVAELNCNYFIDDLPEVFREQRFPENTTKILFDIQSEHSMNYTVNSWWQINELIFNQIETDDIAAYIEKGIHRKVKSVNVIKGRGNSSVYKIEMKSGQISSGKLYPDSTVDDRDRLVKETSAYKFLHSNQINTVPRNIWSDTNLNFGLFEWINGKEIVEITDNHINSAADFVVSLAKLSKHTSHEKFGQASAACFSGEMIDEQIRDRYAVFFEHSNSNSHLVDFLDKDFSTSYKKILSRSKKNWPGEFETVLANEFQILSPSDFGLHNALLTKNGLIFMDFEYFGWDDPAKLTCDFLLHPGMMLTDGQKTLWLERMKEFFSVEKNFQQRCEASYCLYGLCWCLIILNVFVTGRKSNNAGSADENITKGKKQTNRLNRSRDLLEHINKVNNNGLMYE